MGIDLSRVATSALQAALEDGQQPEPKQHHRRLTAGKAIVAGAAVAVAAKYAVDKASPVKRKAALAAVRHTVRNTFGDVIPESLHDKLMDVGFFDNEEEEFFDAPEGEGEQYEEYEVPQDEEPGDEENFFDEPEDEEPGRRSGVLRRARGRGVREPADEEDVEEPEDEDVDEPEDEEPDEPEDEERRRARGRSDEDDEPEDDEDDEPEDEPDDEPDGDAEAEPEDDVDDDDEPRDEEGAQRVARAAPANGRAQAEAPGVMDVLSRTPRRRRRTRRPRVDPAERPPEPPRKRSSKKDKDSTKTGSR